jgi:signal transduction histidine kinase
LLALAIALTAFAAGWAIERRRCRRVEAQNHAILSSISADIAVLSRSGIIETCNQSWLQSRDSGDPFTSAGADEQWLPGDLETPEQRDNLIRVRAALAGVIDGGEPERNVEYAWVARGERRFSQLRIARLDRPGGGAVVARTDVTARKRIEKDTQNALHELAHMNMRAGMGELVSTITHELRQALTASLGNAQALKRMVASGRLDQEDLVAIADDISAANRNASDVIGRIRTLMRKETVEMRAIDLNGIALDVVQTLNSTASNDGVLLVADLDPDLPLVSGDQVQLRQVAMNLVTNAVQATRLHTGGIPVVRVATSSQHGTVSLVVEDAGPGVPEEALPRLFEPYFTTKEEGLGVGLTISRSIVESLGGSIAVSNLPHGGARFSAEFPRANSAA